MQKKVFCFLNTYFVFWNTANTQVWGSLIYLLHVSA